MLAIVFSLALLMTIAYRGVAGHPLRAGLCALGGRALGRSALAELHRDLHGGGGNLYQGVLSSISSRGGVRQADGAERSAGAVAEFIARALGPRHSILAVVLALRFSRTAGYRCSLWRSPSIRYAAALFREPISRNGSSPARSRSVRSPSRWDALPGSPQIQNLIPTRYFGTDTYAAPLAGTLGGLRSLSGPALARSPSRPCRCGGEGYGDDHLNEPETYDRRT